MDNWDQRIRESEKFLRSIPPHLRSPVTKLLVGDGTMDSVDEGFYPDEDMQAYPEVEHCSMVKLKEQHQPHFWVPAFLDENVPAPEFVCGGYPRKIIDIEESR